MVVVSHGVPIRSVVCLALGVPLAAVRRLDAVPGSLPTLSWPVEGAVMLRQFGAIPG